MNSRKLLSTSPKNIAKGASKRSLSRLHQAIETLEGRTLFSFVTSPVFGPTLANPTNPSADTIDLATRITDTAITGTVVEFQTSLGNMDFDLTDSATPLTVQNFLNYVRGGYDSNGNYSQGNGNGSYDGTIFHRSVVFSPTGGFNDPTGGPVPPAKADIVQGGGYFLGNGLTHINTGAPVVNEVNTEVQGNVPGTIAMAKTSDPNSATSEFFFNEHDNSTVLDDPNNSGGFTTFGSIISGGSVLDALASLPTFNLSSDFSTLPVEGLTETQVLNPSTTLSASNLVDLTKVSVIPGITYTATSDNTALVTPTISGNNLSFTYGAGMSGVANITITATSVASGVTTFTYPVTVPDTTKPTEGPTAVDYTAPDIITNTPVTAINPLLHDTDSLSPLDPTTVTIVMPPSHGAINVDPSTGAISYTPAGDYGKDGVQTDSLQYTVKDLSGQVSNPATININVVPSPRTVTLSPHSSSIALAYTQPDGTLVRIGVSNSDTVVTFADYRVTTKKVGTLVVASGLGATVNSIAITQNGFIHGNFSMVARKGIATITTITDNGLLANAIMQNVKLTGTMTVGGVRRLFLDSTDHATINIQGGTIAPAVRVNNAVDTSLTSGLGLISLTSHQWLNTDAGTYTITAPLIGSFVNPGNFADDLKLTNTGLAIGTARVGKITGGTWTISGEANNISANSVASSWSLNDNSLVRSLRLGGNVSNSITCAAIGSMTVTGNLVQSTVQTSAQFSKKFVQFGRLNVGGAIMSSIIYAVGNLGTVSAASMTNSGIYAGTSGTIAGQNALPTTLADYISDATITSVVLRRAKPAFSNGHISAEHIGSLRLGQAKLDNNGSPQGVAAKTINSVFATLDTGGALSLGRAQLKNATVLSSYLTAKKYALKDFGVNLISS